MALREHLLEAFVVWLADDAPPGDDRSDVALRRDTEGRPALAVEWKVYRELVGA